MMALLVLALAVTLAAGGRFEIDSSRRILLGMGHGAVALLAAFLVEGAILSAGLRPVGIGRLRLAAVGISITTISALIVAIPVYLILRSPLLDSVPTLFVAAAVLVWGLVGATSLAVLAVYRWAGWSGHLEPPGIGRAGLIIGSAYVSSGLLGIGWVWTGLFMLDLRNLW